MFSVKMILRAHSHCVKAEVKAKMFLDVYRLSFDNFLFVLLWFIIARNGSCEKVMFSLVSVCQSVGGGLSMHGLVSLPDHTPGMHSRWYSLQISPQTSFIRSARIIVELDWPNNQCVHKQNSAMLIQYTTDSKVNTPRGTIIKRLFEFFTDCTNWQKFGKVLNS